MGRKVGCKKGRAVGSMASLPPSSIQYSRTHSSHSPSLTLIGKLLLRTRRPARLHPPQT